MRVKVDYSQASRKTYERFKLECPEIDVTFDEYVKIIYAFNYAFRDYLLETGEKAKLPFGVGDFAISKHPPTKIKKNPKTGEDMIGLKVDWKKTRELGHKVYHLNRHTDGMSLHVKWFLNSSRFRFSEIWSFKPSRVTSRLINHYIKQSPEAHHKYRQWDLVKRR